MTPLVENAWNSFHDEYFLYGKENSLLNFDESKKSEFKSIFEKKYSHIMKTYMDESVKSLDRHKVAALIIISLIDVSPISIDKLSDEYIFIANELIALKVGLAYMLKKMNDILSEKGNSNKLEQFTFPMAQSCDTPYMDVMCRNLYYAKRDYMLNPLDLADRLFLIEYISLLKSGVNPDILKNY